MFESFFSKFFGISPATLVRIDSDTGFFSTNIAQFLRTPILKRICEPDCWIPLDCFLKICSPKQAMIHLLYALSRLFIIHFIVPAKGPCSLFCENNILLYYSDALTTLLLFHFRVIISSKWF